MDQFWTILCTLFTAITAFFAGLVLERARHHRERRGVAAALAGEIWAILDRNRKREHEAVFRGIHARLENGENASVPNIIARPIELDPVIQNHRPRIGILGEPLSRRILVFHSYVREMRFDLMSLADGDWDGDIALKARKLGEDLALWEETKQLGDELVKELQTICSNSARLVA